MKTKTEEQRFRVQIGLSILTAVLTAVITAGLVGYQLSSEHSFSEQQATLAHKQRMLEEKIRLHRDVVRLGHEQHDRLAKVHLMLGEVLDLAMGSREPQQAMEVVSKLIDTLFADVDDLLETKAQLASSLDIAPHYFGKDVKAAIDRYRNGSNLAVGRPLEGAKEADDTGLHSTAYANAVEGSMEASDIKRLVQNIVDKLPSSRAETARTQINLLDTTIDTSETAFRGITSAMAAEITAGL